MNPAVDVPFALMFGGCLISSMIGQIFGQGMVYVYYVVCDVYNSFRLRFRDFCNSEILTTLNAKGATMALEKDWVVVLCQGHKSLLTTINSRMRRIDLFCKLVAPALFGIVTQFLGSNSMEKIQYGTAWVAGWNVVGLFLGIYSDFI